MIADAELADITGRTTVRAVKRAAYAGDVADLTTTYLRDFHLCTETEMKERWGPLLDLKKTLKLGLEEAYSPWDDTRLRATFLDTSRAADALDTEWAGHNPIYEYGRSFFYYGAWVDRFTQKRVSKVDYWLFEPFHKEILANLIQAQLLGKIDPNIVGAAVFVSRNALKTYWMIIAGAYFLTRYRVLFNDFATLRITHDIESAAKWRGDQIKQLFQYCRPFRSLYHECRIKPGAKWGASEAWNMPGRQEADKLSLDPQVVCCGVKAAKQGAHPDADLIDDAEGERHMRSAASREESQVFIKGLMYAAQFASCRRLLMGTFYSPYGTHAMIVDSCKPEDDYGNPQEPMWRIAHLPAVASDAQLLAAGARDLEAFPLAEKMGGRLLYPTRLYETALDAGRRNEERLYGTDVFWQMQMMLRFRGDMESRFKAQMHLVNLLNPRTDEERQLEKSIAYGTRAVFADLAQKNEDTRGTGDNNAIVTVGFSFLDGAAPIRTLIDATYNDIFDINQCVEEMMRQAKLYKVDWIFPEEPGQKTIGPLCAAYAAQKGLPYTQAFLRPGSGVTEGNIVAIVPKRLAKGAKEAAGMAAARFSSWQWALINAFIADYNGGRWRFAKGIDCIDGLCEEMDVFPHGKTGVGDDFLMALSIGYDERIKALLPMPRMRGASFRDMTGSPYTLRPTIPNTGLVERVYTNQYRDPRASKGGWMQPWM